MYRKLPRFLALLSAALLSPQAFSAAVCVNQNAPAPLEFCVDDAGRPSVWVQQPNGRHHQYYAQNSWGSYLRFHADGVGTNFSTSYIGAAEAAAATAVANTLAGTGSAVDPYVVTTVMTLGTSGIRLTQEFRYVNGDRHISKAWTLENTGSVAYNDLRFFHGGDAYFGGTDSARTWYDADLRMLYLTNTQVQNYGYMAFFANPLTPASHYFGGSYSTGRNAIRTSASLSDQASSAYVDAGYYLQWNRPNLLPGQSWRIEAFEKWTPPGAVQVLTSGDQYTLAGETVRKVFKIQNLDESVSRTISWSASSTSGWTLGMPGSNTATLAPLQIVSVPVDVHVPAGAAAGSSAAITLEVMENAVVTGAGTARLTIAAIDHTLSTRLLDFGTDVVEGEYRQLDVTFTNGASAVSLGEAGAGNPLAAPFAIVTDECSGVTLAPLAACKLTVRFSPTTAAEFNDSFSLPVTSTVMVSETISTTGVSQGRIPVSTIAGAGGSISPANDAVGPGRSASFTVQPDANYRIASVEGCGGSLAGNIYTTAPVNTACTVQARFERVVHALGAAPAQHGSITPLQASVPQGDAATFFLTPDPGHAIGAVAGCPGTLNGNAFTTAPVTGPCTLSVTFDPVLSTVTLHGGRGGGGSTGLLSLGGLLLLAWRRLRGASALAVAGITVASGVNAAEAPAIRLHAGATVGAATSSESARGITSALREQGHQLTAGLDDRRAMWRIHGGWSIHPLVAVEVGYSDLGEVRTSFEGTLSVVEVDAALDAAAALQPREATGFDLSLTGRYPLAFADRLSVLGRAGLFRWSAQRRIDASDGRTSVRYAEGANLLLGAGVGLGISQHVEVSAEWLRYGMGADSVQAAALGIRYRW